MVLRAKNLVVGLVACVLVASACSSGTDLLAPIEEDPSAVTTTETTVGSTTEPEVESDPEMLAEVWTALFVASGLPAEERAPAIAELEPTVPAEFGEVVAAIVDELQVSEVWPHPIVSVRFDGVATIRDCMIYAPSLDGSSTVYVEGKAEADGEGGWVLTDYDRLRDGCIPGEIQDAILAGYADFEAAAREFNDPPNPDHPLIAETSTDGVLASTRDGQAFLRDSGYQLRIDLESHPEVIELYRDDVAIVRDCQLIGPDGGLFDADGNPPEDVAPFTEAGKRNMVTYRLRRENGKWKLSETEETFEQDSDCQLPPTPQGLERID